MYWSTRCVEIPSIIRPARLGSIKRLMEIRDLASPYLFNETFAAAAIFGALRELKTFKRFIRTVFSFEKRGSMARFRHRRLKIAAAFSLLIREPRFRCQQQDKRQRYSRP